MKQAKSANSEGVYVLHVKDVELWLLPEKAVYRPDLNELIISDVHIGKAAHFRKNGIPVSGMVNRNNFWLLSGLFDKYQPDSVVFLGDLSHSSHNAEWEDFVDFLQNYSHIQFELVTGNHDILPVSLYKEAGINCYEKILRQEICYLHDWEMNPDFTLSGHIHPAVKLSGNARQYLRLDCFWQRENNLVLPAFGDFTGRKIIDIENGHQVFLIAGEKVIAH